MKLTPEQHAQARRARDQGRITQTEYDYLVGNEHTNKQTHEQTNTQTHERKRRDATIRFGAAAAMVLVMIIAFFLTSGGITGLITAEWNETTFTNNTVIDLGVTNIAGLKISGVLHNGSATVIARIGNETLLVFNESINEPRIWTAQRSYAINETILAVVDLQNYTLWLDNGNKTPVDNPFSVEQPGEYILEALGDEKLSISITIRNDTEENTNDTRTQEPIRFMNACMESCVITPQNETTLLEIQTDGSINITDVYVTSENHAPTQIKNIPDITLNGTETLNLSEYFIDDDGDTLSYEMNNLLGIVERINGELLTLEGDIPGTYLGRIYASDGQALTTTEFTITIPATPNETTVDETNNTTPTTGTPVNETQERTPEFTNCLDADPNKRPLDCIQNETNYFLEQEIVLENIDREVVGKFTPIGNLLITGDYIEYSTASPRARDWSIGYIGGVGEYTPTIWIDTETGDLHLRGRLIEANTNIIHEEGMYGLTNQRGILLAKAERTTGDLTVRGNIIPYRRTLT